MRSSEAAAGPPPTPERPRETKRRKTMTGVPSLRINQCIANNNKRTARSLDGTASNPFKIDDDSSIVDLTQNEVDLTVIESDSSDGDDDEPLVVGTFKPEIKSPYARSNTFGGTCGIARKKSHPSKVPYKDSPPKKPPLARDTHVVVIAPRAGAPPAKPPPKKPPPAYQSPPTKPSSATFHNVARFPPQSSPISDYERGYMQTKQSTKPTGRTDNDDLDGRKPAAKPRIGSPPTYSPTLSRIQGRSILLKRPAFKTTTRSSDDDKQLPSSNVNPRNDNITSEGNEKSRHVATKKKPGNLSSGDLKEKGVEEELFIIEQELAKFEKPQKVGPYSYDEFLKLWLEGEVIFENKYKKTFEQIEKGSLFRQANREVDKKGSDGGQSSAQYGRMMPSMIQELLENIVDLKKGMICVDIGHGLGNICAQVAMTSGCEARGIELVDDRHFASLQVLDLLLGLHNRIIQSENKEHEVGEIKLELGRFEDPKHHKFFSEADCLICNNFNEVFGSRSKLEGQKYTLNDYLVGLFCRMKKGAVLVTLDKLDIVSQKAANERRKLRGLQPSETASFFEKEEIYYEDIAENRGLLSWRKINLSFTVYKYTRNQSEVATFLCDSVKCDYAKSCTPIVAWQELENGKVVLNTCPCCGEKPSGAADRTRKAPDRFVAKS